MTGGDATVRQRVEALRVALGGPKGLGWLVVAVTGLLYTAVPVAWAVPPLLGALADGTTARELGIVALIATFVAVYVGYGAWFWRRVLARRDPFLDWWCGGGEAPATTTARPVGLLVPLAVLLVPLVLPPGETVLVAGVASLGAVLAVASVVATRRVTPQALATDQWAVPAAWLVQSTAMHAVVVVGGDVPVAPTTMSVATLVPVGVFYFADLDRHWTTDGPLSYGLECLFLGGGTWLLVAARLANRRVPAVLLAAIGALHLVAFAVAVADRVRETDGPFW